LGLGIGLRLGLSRRNLALVLGCCCGRLAFFLLPQQVAELGVLLKLASFEVFQGLFGLDPAGLGLLGQRSGLGLLVLERLLFLLQGVEEDFVIVGGRSARIDGHAGEVVTLKSLVDGYWIGEQRTECTTSSTHHLLDGDVAELNFQLGDLNLLASDPLLRNNDLGVELGFLSQGDDDVFVVLIDLLVHPVDLGQDLLHGFFLIAHATCRRWLEGECPTAQPKDGGKRKTGQE